MLDHWVEHGFPTYITLAAHHGYSKPSEGGTPPEGSEGGFGNLDDLEQMFSDTGGQIG